MPNNCPHCNRSIRPNNWLRHIEACSKPKPLKKVRGVDYDPNWGYKTGDRQAWNKGKPRPDSDFKRHDHEVFVEDSTYSRCNIKKRIIRKNLIEYKCSLCPTEDMWQGKPLSLHLDHVNGVNNDHRIENLRFLCPNCHSQTETYAGKNKGIKRV